jgi:ribonucleoside-diphosphate reductase alpha chain
MNAQLPYPNPFITTRYPLMSCRAGVVHKAHVAGFEFFIRTGEYEDGRLGEVFVDISKEGSTLSGLVDGVMKATSIALQHGVPLATLADKMVHTRFEPSGFTGNPDIPVATSVLDYIFRYLSRRYTVEPAAKAALEIQNGESES